MTQRSIAFCLSDLHSHFQLGLFNPQTEYLDEHGNKFKVKPNTTQKVLHRVVQKAIKGAQKLAAGDPIDVFVCGDVTHGNHFIEAQMTTRLADQITTAYWNLKPVIAMNGVASVQFSEGTGVHSYGQGSTEEILTRMFNLEFPDIEISYHPHARTDVGGEFEIESFHHGPSPGTMESTHGNAARNFLKDRMLKDLSWGRKPASLYLCGHFHKYTPVSYGMEWDNVWYESRLIILPPLCTLGSFGRKVTKTLPSVEVGVIVLEIEDGQIRRTHKFTEDIDQRVYRKVR